MRVIDVDEAIEKINGLCVDGNENWIGSENQSFVDHADVIDILSSIPTVDAVPVVHGEWTTIEDDILMETVYQCSVCKEEFVTLDGEHPTEHLWNYCPNCGAKMDGGNENE